MGGGLLRMLTLANAVSPSAADAIGLRRFAKLIEQSSSTLISARGNPSVTRGIQAKR
jgi:hypothetical protein